MGGFYTSLHVLVGDAASDDAVARAVSKAVVAGGVVVPVADGAEPDQVVLVSPVEAGAPWVTIFDEGLEQDEVSLDALAARVTSELKTWAVGIIVHDSDVVVLRLHKDGALLDVYNSGPDYFGEVTAKEKRAVAGHAQRWKPLLAEGVKVAGLRELMKGGEEPAMGEELVEKLAPMLGLEPRLALNSFSYLHEDPDEEQRETLARMTRLAFSRVPKAPGSEPPVRLVRDLRTLETDVLNESAEGERSPGERFGSQACFVVSDGRALTDGFDVEIRGSAIERGLFVPREIQGNGAGELVLRVIPKENPDGSVARSYALSVQPLPDSPFPRRALKEQRGAVAFRRVHRQRIAAASAFLRHAAGIPALLASAAERWSSFIQPEVETSTWTVFSGQRAGELPVAGPGIERLQGWKEVAARLGTASLIIRRGGAGQAQPNIGSQLSPRSDGFSALVLGDGLILFGLWHYIEGMPAGLRAQGAALLQRLIDEIAGAADVEQAFITRWDWAPTRNMATPYEQLVDRSASTVGPYASSLLHAVTELMWIGPRLGARIDFARVREVADVRSVGATSFVSLRESRGLDELERALANALPGPERFEPGDLVGPPGWSAPHE